MDAAHPFGRGAVVCGQGIPPIPPHLKLEREHDVVGESLSCGSGGVIALGLALQCSHLYLHTGQMHEHVCD